MRTALLLGILLAAMASTRISVGQTTHVIMGNVTGYDGSGGLGSGPWLTGDTYVLLAKVTVPQNETLTIQPGVTIKTGAGVNAGLDAFGTLNAVGTPGQPIRFTSYKDDSIGGDHNGDGAATSPAPGDWSRLTVISGTPTTTLEWCEFHWGGSGVGSGAVYWSSSGGSVKNCLFRKSAHGGLYNATASFSPTAIENCQFIDCRDPVVNVNVNDVHRHVGNTASGSINGDVMRLAVQAATFTGSRTWAATNTLNGAGIIAVPHTVKVPAGLTWTLGAGIILKATAPIVRYTILGALNVNGTGGAPVVLTSLADDASGGDSANDGPTSGLAGDWNGILFSSISTLTSTLDHFHVHYGGGLGAAVEADAPNIVFTNCRFANSALDGLDPGNNANIVISGCAFDDNAGRPISILGIDALAGFSGNTASGNGLGDILMIGGSMTAPMTTLGPAASFNGAAVIGVASTVTIGSGKVLTLAPGVILKFGSPGNPKLHINGRLLSNGTPQNPVVLTSLKDDSHGGDSNADGGATTPAPADWDRLAVVSDDTTVLTHTLVRYASAGIHLNGADISMNDVTVEYSANAGLRLENSAPLCDGLSVNFCGLPAPIIGIKLDALPNFSNTTAVGNAGSNEFLFDASAVNSPLTVGPANAMNGSGVLLFQGTLTVTDALTLEAGLTLKFVGNHSVISSTGTLRTNGTATNPVVFTSAADDVHGGDSLGDGPTTGTPGDWAGLVFSLDFTSNLNHTRIRFAGSSPLGAIDCDVSNPTLTGVAVEKSASHGLVLDYNSRPVLAGCAFNECTIPILNSSIKALANFSGCTAQNNSAGDTIRVAYEAGVGNVIDPSMSLNGSGVFVFKNNMTVNDLVIQPGVIVKMEDGISLTVATSFSTPGSTASPVIFTSVHDNDFGGDSNGPAINQAPTKGSWGGVVSNAATGTIDHTLFRYAGSAGSALLLNSSNITVSNSLFLDCLTNAIEVTGTSAPLIVGNTFVNICGDDVANLTWAVLGGMRDNVFSAGSGGVVHMYDPAVSGHVRIDAFNYPGDCIVVHTSPALAETGASATSLSFGPGVVVKVADPSVRFVLNSVAFIEGTGAEPVVFTSYADDTVCGDTNGDGNATSPAGGDWIGVVMYGGTISHTTVRYAGATDATMTNWPLPAPGGAIRGSAAVDSTRVEYSANDGFVLNFGTYNNLVAFSNQGNGISGGNLGACSPPQCAIPSFFISCTSVSNGGYGIGGTQNIQSYACISWNNGVANFHNINGAQFWCCGSTAVPCPPGGPLCPIIGDHNIYTDPMFVDQAGGDLHLQAGSPCLDYWVNTLILGTPVVNGSDFEDNSRGIDSDGPGPRPAKDDIGAYERPPFVMFTLGRPELGTTMSFIVGYDPGYALWFFGSGADAERISPYGHLLTGLGSTSLYLGITPTLALFHVNLPDIPILAGFPIAIQAWAAPTTATSSGAFTNYFRGTLFE